jgi:hypothetical protein
MLDKVDELWSREQIRQLAYSYAYAVDTLDWNLMDSLWMPDYPAPPAPPPLLDYHAMRKLPAKFAQQGASMLLVGNHRINFENSDKAKGTVYCHCFVDRDYLLEQTIVYVDAYERRDGKWLFVQRDHLLMWGRDGGENPMKLPSADWPKSQIGAGTAAQVLRSR